MAIGIMAVTLLLATLNPVLIADVMLAGEAFWSWWSASLLTMDQVYSAIEWRTIFLVAGLLPLGLAIEQSGRTAAGRAPGSLAAALGPLALLAGLALLAVLLVQVINGAAVASVITRSPSRPRSRPAWTRALAMGVALACSMAFMTPLGHTVNILVMGPAGYRFSDFFRIGLPLTVVVFTVMMILLPHVLAAGYPYSMSRARRCINPTRRSAPDYTWSISP